MHGYVTTLVFHLLHLAVHRKIYLQCHLSTMSLILHWRYLNGHLISIKPGPQHSHSTSPSGVAPRCGYCTLTCNPVDRYLNETCISFAPFRYSSLAVASFFVPQSKAGTPLSFYSLPLLLLQEKLVVDLEKLC